MRHPTLVAKGPTAPALRRLTLIALLALGACGDDTKRGPVRFDEADPESMARAQTMAEDYAHERMADMDMGATTMRMGRIDVDDLGMAHARMQQMLGDVPVWTGALIVHLQADGALDDMTMDVLEGVAVDPVPAMSADDAMNVALEAKGGPAYATSQPVADMWVMRRDDGDHLVYRVTFEHLVGVDGEDAVPVMFVDAHSGDVVYAYDNLQTATARGQGVGNYYTIVYLDDWYGLKYYYLEDRGRSFGVYSNRGTSAVPNTTGLYYQLDSDNKWGGDPLQNAGVDAHWAAATFLDWLRDRYGRNGVDGAGGPGFAPSLDTGRVLTLITNYGTNYNNAGWVSSKYAYFGDGDGSANASFTSFDAVVHELTHGLTQYTSGLVYDDQSGALNESTSDIFAAVAERSIFGVSQENWELGEDFHTPAVAGDALRYMFYPTGDGASRDFYLFRNPDSANADNHGVHTNSGIGNLAFYLLAEGGSNRTCPAVTVTKISPDAALALWYRAMRYYWTPGTDFADARAGLLSAAAAAYGSTGPVYKAVQDAWAAVGVGASSSGSTNLCGTSTTGHVGDHETDYYPSVTGKAITEGAIGGVLTTQSSGILNFYVQQLVSGSWQTFAFSDGTSTRKTFEKHAPAGTYRVVVESGYGASDYSVRYRLP